MAPLEIRHRSIRSISAKHAQASRFLQQSPVLGVAASWERQRIAERTGVGRAQAKARGVKFGRKSALTPHQQAEALRKLDAGDTQRTVAALFNVSQATISRLQERRP